MSKQQEEQSLLYFNREISLLEFNIRVLSQATFESIPLLERLNYLCISCSNLDEFYEIRVAGLLQLAEVDSPLMSSEGLTVHQQLELIKIRSHELVAEQYRVLNEVLFPLLAVENIHFLKRVDWSEKQHQWLSDYFFQHLRPILTPVGLDSAHPFPRILNKSLNFIIALSGKDAFGRNSERAILQAPRSLPRIIQLPKDETDSGDYDFVFLTSIIHEFVNDLFHGMTVVGCHQFRVTRNSDFFVDEEATDDLMNAMKGELALRNYGDEVRLEIDTHCPELTVDFLMARFELTDDRLFLAEGPVNIVRLQQIYKLIDRPDLKFPKYTPKVPAKLSSKKNYFDVIRKNDVLLHHPFESFAPVVEFLRQAAKDPDVVAIKQTLYRTGAKSPIVEALVNAARTGKEVTVVIELRARFDEQDNIDLANRLQKEAVHVVYGVVGYKTHAKMCLVLRREEKTFRYYMHMGTGNYHPQTACLYTDYGLFTSDPKLGEDIQRVFVQLTSLGKVAKLNKLLQSPFTLHKGVLDRIAKEIEYAESGNKARIIFKVNSLVEEKIIQALYKASQAGVKVQLIVRGVCCLKPGVPGVSENIEVRSIIGRFLEHTRVYAFRNKGDYEVLASSADFMVRNMFSRVEISFPITSKVLHDRVLKELDCYLKDNTQAWLLQSDGRYQQAVPADESKRHSAQVELMKKLTK
ncbi:MAG: polyphosphate kinase 1 [Methylococcales bacterium]|nr:polyphosphate kinase 1 [Methylococcales bacterium]